MADMVVRVSVAFLAILGLLWLCQKAIDWIWRPMGKQVMRWVLPLKGNDEEIEFEVRGMAERIRWMRIPGDKKLICVDYGIGEEARKICDRLCQDDPMILYCKSEELSQELEHTFANT